jgi:hypothetical protein
VKLPFVNLTYTLRERERKREREKKVGVGGCERNYRLEGVVIET